ncbi:MAG: TRAP transporter substrate-binding protein [Candidatus Dadabacteria bacterium]|nr:MAG: TRAP transporter substrate-binding protein [Candidatus Dadabacteria bacterium]
MKFFRYLIVAALSFFVSATAGAEVTKVKLGTMAPDGSPWDESLELMSKNLQQATGGQFRWQIFPGGQLGDEIQMVESTQIGAIECSGISTGALANLVPSMQVFEIPFYWKSREEAYYVIDNYFRDFFAKEVEKIGLVLLGWSENGWRHFFIKGDRKVRTPDDLKGLRMRTQESPVHIAFWKALGVNPIPLATTEIYQALERGIIDGGDNTLVLIMATGWAEIINEVTLSGHIYQPAVMVCNKGWWDTVSKQHQQVFYSMMREAEKDMRGRLLKAERELADVIKSMGREVIELTPQEREQFRARTAGIANDPKIRAMIGAEALRLAEQGKAEYRKQHGEK